MAIAEEKPTSVYTEVGNEAGKHDPHSLIFEARAHLQGVQALAGQANGELEDLTGWQLHQMLEPIVERMRQALEGMGGDPEVIKT